MEADRPVARELLEVGPVILVEAHNYVLNEQHRHFRATHVTILQYDAGQFDPRVLYKVICTLQLTKTLGPSILHHIEVLLCVLL